MYSQIKSPPPPIVVSTFKLESTVPKDVKRKFKLVWRIISEKKKIDMDFFLHYYAKFDPHLYPSLSSRIMIWRNLNHHYLRIFSISNNLSGNWFLTRRFQTYFSIYLYVKIRPPPPLLLHSIPWDRHISYKLKSAIPKDVSTQVKACLANQFLIIFLCSI